MKPIVFYLTNNVQLSEAIKKTDCYEEGEIIFRQFPDQETYVKINTNVKDRQIVFVVNLEYPNSKILPLLFAAQTVRDLGAKNVRLVAPYLVYMRQDKRFNPGEAVTSQYFAKLLSTYFDSLITIDPHLHRLLALNEVYSIPTFVLHATNPISQWIAEHVEDPVIIGPDQESKQWVSDVARKINAPFVVLEKMRKGDRDINVSLSGMEQYQNCTPVLVDDIISSARTMIEPVKQLTNKGMKPAVCIGVHAVFAENAYDDLLHAGAGEVVTCNTIDHISNQIDISELIVETLKEAIP